MSVPFVDVSMAHIASVFGQGKPVPHSLAQFYRGGAYVGASDAASTVPTSGAISMADFRGTAKALSQTLTANLIRRTIDPGPDNGLTFSSGTASFNAGFHNLAFTQLLHANSFALEALDNYACEYTGWLTVSTTGTYTFGVRSDDGSDLAIWIGSTWDIVTSAYGYKAAELTPPNPQSRTLTANVSYPIRIRYHERQGGQELRVEWMTPAAPATWAAIPFSNFFCNGKTPISTDSIREAGFPDPRVA